MILSLVKKYIWVINLILIAALAYTLAQIVNDKVRGKVSTLPKLKHQSAHTNKDKAIARSNMTDLSSYDVIMERNIFGLASTSFGSSDVDPETARLSTLNLQLLATVIKAGDKSIAVVKNVDSGKARSYGEGDVIDIVQSEKVKLSKIGNCIIIVERKEAEKIKCKNINDEQVAAAPSQLNVDSSPLIQGLRNRDRDRSSGSDAKGIKEVSEGVYEVEQRMLDELLGDPNQLVTQARVIPQDDGLKLFAIRPSSVFFKIGLRNGDTIHEINRVKLDNIENALSLFEELKNQNQFSIDITRRGQRLTYEYRVK